jgi:ABC-type multidrug transport system ATPase subunit
MGMFEEAPRTCTGLQVTLLRKTFGERVAVDDISFALEPGTITGFLGPNGAGKTTTFLCLFGLLRPDAGEICLDGVLLAGDRGGKIALIPETPEVFPLLTVWEHFAFVAAGRGLDGWEPRAEELLARFGLRAERRTLGGALSKGMRQKTLIAATVLCDTPVLLLDEPMIGLDPKGQAELRALLEELAAAGKCVAVSTHALESAQRLCRQVVILKAGRVVASGPPEGLRGSGHGGGTLEEIFLSLTA